MTTRLVLGAFVILALAPFAVAATRSSFWQREHSMAPLATALYLAVVLALVVGRYRWAWVLLVLFYGAAAMTWAFDSRRFHPMYLLGFALGVSVFALLLSAPMRHRVRPALVARRRL